MFEVIGTFFLAAQLIAGVGQPATWLSRGSHKAIVTVVDDTLIPGTPYELKQALPACRTEAALERLREFGEDPKVRRKAMMMAEILDDCRYFKADETVLYEDRDVSGAARFRRPGDADSSWTIYNELRAAVLGDRDAK